MPVLSFSVGKMSGSTKEDRISQVFCLGAVVTIRVTEDSAAIKILRKRPDGIQGIFPGFCVKYSTVHALISLTENIRENLEEVRRVTRNFLGQGRFLKITALQ